MQNAVNADAGSATPPLIERTLTLAAAHRSAGRHEPAALLYRQILDSEPDNAEALDGLAAVAPSPPAGRRSLARRLGHRYVRPAIEGAAQRPRIWKYRVLSTCSRVSGSPRVLQPVLLVGSGEIAFGEGVQLGWPRSPLFYTGYSHIEAATPDARILLGDRTEFNNNAFLKSEGAGIRVGRDGLFGAHVEIFDSNFHDLDPTRRVGGTPKMAPVEIGDNVFVGMGVRILKGVTIGDDSVIGAGAVVTSSIPAGVIAAGNPARVVREL
jgi:acetyltransferase-like isoleucine patch superfamily enzyme